MFIIITARVFTAVEIADRLTAGLWKKINVLTVSTITESIVSSREVGVTELDFPCMNSDCNLIMAFFF